MRTVIASIVAIYRKELQGYFASPFAYIIAAIFWILGGTSFYSTLTFITSNTAGQSFDAAYVLLGGVPGTGFLGFLGTLGSLSLAILPMLSMGLYTEERKHSTLELLATSPITNWAVALGKLLGIVTFFITMLLPLMIYESIALSAASPPIRPAVFFVGHIGLILMASAVLSLGMFISSLTSSTILAVILTYALVIFLWIIDQIAGIGGAIGDALTHLSLYKNYSSLFQGILDTSSLILFSSYIILGLFLTAQSIEAFRFQRS